MAPRKLELGEPAVSVTSGVHFSCAAVADGVRCWGDGTHAQLGIANFDPALPLGHTAKPVVVRTDPRRAGLFN